MKDHPEVYASQEKSKWREFIYNTLTEKNCVKLINADGKFPYKWLEPIGKDALPFRQLIDSGRILEEQLIGIDLDPKHEQRSRANVEACKLKFPKAEFNAMDWAAYCRRCKHEDIGYFIFDLYNSTFGENLRAQLAPTIKLIDRCKKNLGECLLVINCDLGFAKRMNKGTPEEFALEIESILQTSSIESIRLTRINPTSIYRYTGDKTEMATFVLVL